MEAETAITSWKDYNDYVAFTAAPTRVFMHHERACELQLCPGMRFEVLSSERDTYWIAQLIRFDDKQLTLKWETSSKTDTPSRGAAKSDAHEFVVERSANRVKRLGWAAANRVRAKVPHGVTVRGNTDSLLDDLVRSARVSNADTSQDGVGYNAIECLCINMVFEFMYDASDAKAVWFVRVVSNLGGRLLLAFVSQPDAVFADEVKTEEPSGKGKPGRKPSPKKSKPDSESEANADGFWCYYTDFRLNAVGFVEQHSARQFRYAAPAHLHLSDEQTARVRAVILARRNAVSPLEVVWDRRAPLSKHAFTLNERLEALDTASPMHIRPARVSAVHDDYYFSVTFDAYREASSKKLEVASDSVTTLCSASSNTLFPVYFGKANALVLTAPRGYAAARELARDRDEPESSRADSTSHDVDWYDYLRTLSHLGMLNAANEEHEHETKKQRTKAKSEPEDSGTRKYAHLNNAATRLYPAFLKRGQKLECVNPRDPFELVLVTVQRVLDSLLWVVMDADPHLFVKHGGGKQAASEEGESQCFFMRIDSTDLFPVGFAQRYMAGANAPLASHRRRVRFRFPFVPRTLACESRDSVRLYVNAASCFVGQSLSAARLSTQPPALGGETDCSVSESVKQLLSLLLGSSVRPSNLLRMLKSAAARKAKRSNAGISAVAAARVANETVQLRVDGQLHETDSRVCQTRFALIDFLRNLCANLDCCPYLFSPYRIGASVGRSKGDEFLIERCPAHCDCFFVSRQRLKRETVQRRLAQLEQFGITRAQINDTLSTIERYKLGEKRDDAEPSDAEDTSPKNGKKSEPPKSAKRPVKAAQKPPADTESVSTVSFSSAGRKRKAPSPGPDIRKRTPEEPKKRSNSERTPGPRKRPPTRSAALDNTLDSVQHSDSDSDSQSFLLSQSVSLSTSELSNLDSANDHSLSSDDSDSEAESSESQSVAESLERQLTPAKRKRPEAKTARSNQRKTPQTHASASKPTRQSVNGNSAESRPTASASASASATTTASKVDVNAKTPRKRENAANSDSTPKGVAKQRDAATKQPDNATPASSQARFVPPMSPPIRLEQSVSSVSAANPHAVAVVRRHVSANMNPLTWTVQELAEYLRGVPDCGALIARRINEEQIDGRAFLLLTVPLIREQLKVPLGPALKLSVQVEKLKLLYVNCFA